MTSATVTCVIPTHQRPQFLVHSVTAAVRQTHAPVEVIVVSDIEDRDAEDTCARLAEESGVDVRYVFNDDSHTGGASSSRNAGARLASGTFLAFLDDDDLWDPDYLEQALARLEATGADFCVTWLTVFTDSVVQPGASMPPGLGARDVVVMNPGATGSNLVIRSTSFAEVGGFDAKLPVKNDTDLLTRMLRAGCTYAVVSERLVHQRKHAFGQLTDVGLKRARGTELYLEKHRPHLTRRDLRRLKRSIHQLRSRSADTWYKRRYHEAQILYLYEPRELVRKVVEGRRQGLQRVVRDGTD